MKKLEKVTILEIKRLILDRISDEENNFIFVSMVDILGLLPSKPTIKEIDKSSYRRSVIYQWLKEDVDEAI